VIYSPMAMKKLVVETFLSKKDFYHPIAAKMLAVDLMVSMEKENTDIEIEQEDKKNAIKYSHVMSSNMISMTMMTLACLAGILALRRRK